MRMPCSITIEMIMRIIDEESRVIRNLAHETSKHFSPSRQAVDRPVEAAEHDRETENIGNDPQGNRRILDQSVLQGPIFLQAIHPGRPLVTGLLQIDAPREHCQVHGEEVAPQVTDDELDDEHVGHSQNRFNAMDPEADVELPAWYVAAGDYGVKQNEASAAQDDNPPKDGPVIKLFPITPAIESRRFSHTREPGNMMEKPYNISGLGQQKIGA